MPKCRECALLDMDNPSTPPALTLAFGEIYPCRRNNYIYRKPDADAPDCFVQRGFGIPKQRKVGSDE